MLREIDIVGRSSEEVLKALSDELGRLLPRPSDSRFLAMAKQIPLGLRAMAVTYYLDVSLALDDLGWHFGNYHSKRLAKETAWGLEELGAAELAHLFRKAFQLARKYWRELGRKNWDTWYGESALSKSLDALNGRAWEILRGKEYRIMGYWVDYARRYPERLGISET